MQNQTNPQTIIPKQFSTFGPIESPYMVVGNNSNDVLGLVPCSKLNGNNLFARHQNGNSCWGLVSNNDTKWVNQYDHSLSCYNNSLNLTQFHGSNQSDPTNQLSKVHDLTIAGPNIGESSGKITSSHSVRFAEPNSFKFAISGNSVESSCSGLGCQSIYNEQIYNKNNNQQNPFSYSALNNGTYGQHCRNNLNSNFRVMTNIYDR
jgi:hypothetical protein